MTASPGTDSPFPSDETFGARLKRLLADRQMSQTLLAKQSSIDRSDINRFCNDKRFPTPEQLEWIAGVVGLAAEDLLEGIDVPEGGRTKKRLEHIEALINRVLEADRAREKAQAERNELKTILDGEQKMRTEENRRYANLTNGLQAELHEVRTALAEVMSENEALRVQHVGQASMITRLRRENSEVRAAVASGAAGAALLGGLAGLLIGSSRDKEDD